VAGGVPMSPDSQVPTYEPPRIERRDSISFDEIVDVDDIGDVRIVVVVVDYGVVDDRIIAN
jgi:hypothetical protein